MTDDAVGMTEKSYGPVSVSTMHSNDFRSWAISADLWKINLGFSFSYYPEGRDND